MLRWMNETLASPFGDVRVLSWAVDEDATGSAPVESDPTPDLDVAEDQLGAVLWNSNQTVLEYLRDTVVAQRPLRSLRMVELGAGVGALGIALAVGGAATAVTDIKELLPLMRRNIALNLRSMQASGGSCIATAWKWGEFPPPSAVAEFLKKGPVTHVLLCDALYGNPKDWPHLIETLNAIADTHGDVTVLNFCEQRVDNVEDGFLALLSANDKRWSSTTSDVLRSSELGMKIRVSTMQRAVSSAASNSNADKERVVATGQRHRKRAREC